VAEGILPAAKATVIGNGSICGVDFRRFKPDASARHAVRSELLIPDPATVLLFVGRLGRDKGVLDLASAFASLSRRFPDLHLLLVGPDEEALLEPVRARCGDGADRLRHVTHTPKPERFMAAADLLCLPSYREGFGMVVIEAASAGLAVVASHIYGITDAVADGETGVLFPPGDVAAMAAALERLIVDHRERVAMGAKGRERVLAEFSEERLTYGLMAYYDKSLEP
jgi:glycosyltransferase involved in cell wall biosynthesis